MRKVVLGTVWCANQPPVQLDETIQKIDRECYSPLFEWLSRNDGLKVNVAINKSLAELLIRNKCSKTIDYLGRAAQKGAVELLGGLAYHPLAPLIAASRYGKEEIKRQNELNHSFNKKIFGDLWNPEGLYLPEFGYSEEIGRLIKEMGYRYTITNGLLYAEKNRKPQPFDRIVESDGICLFFTSDWSREFAMTRPDKGDCDTKRLINDMFNGMLSWFQGKNGYTVWGYDIETIGHHQRGYGTHNLDMMVQGIKENDMESVLLKDLLRMFPERENAEMFPGTQSTSAGDIYAGEFFPLWLHSKNSIHKRIWEIEDYAIEVVNETAKISNSGTYKIARGNIDRGLYSCKAWHANPLGGHFTPWVITKGIDNLMKGINGCYFLLKDSDRKIMVKGGEIDSEEVLEKAKNLEKRILKAIWKEELNIHLE